MIRKTILPLLVAVMGASLAACSSSGEQDPYALVTLRDVARGTVVSKGFKYKFQNPQIVAMHRNLAVIQEGNVMESSVRAALRGQARGLHRRLFRALRC